MSSGLTSALDSQRETQFEPLTEREVKTISRLLSDPTVFPREFKKWVTEHASDSVDIAKGQVHGLINSKGQLVFSSASWEQLGIALTGLVLPWIAKTPPADNWLLCDGAFYAEADYPYLFALIGHAFDLTPFTGHFGVPDLRGRTIYGYDEQAGTGYMAFSTHDGAALGGRGPWHHHSLSNHAHGMSHSHGLHTVLGGIPAGGAGYADGGGTGGGTTGGPSFTATSGPDINQTSGPPPTDGGAWMALNYIIASGKVPT